jgi:hypothetical protein
MRRFLSKESIQGSPNNRSIEEGEERGVGEHS